MAVIKKYERNPMEVEVLAYDGKNFEEIIEFSGDNASYWPGLNQLRLMLKVRKNPPVRAGISLPAPVMCLVNVGDVVMKEPDGFLSLVSYEELQIEYTEAK